MTTAVPGAGNGRAGTPEDGPSDGLLDEVLALLPDAVAVAVAVRDADGRAVDLRLAHANAAGAVSVGCPRGGLWSRTADDGLLAACLDVLNTGLPGYGTFAPAGTGAHRPADRAYRASPLGKDHLLLVLRDGGAGEGENDGNGDREDRDDRDDRERLRILADAGAALGASLDRGETLDAVTASVVPRFADGCLLYLVDDTGRPALAALAHRDPQRRRDLRDLAGAASPRPDAEDGVGAVVRTGRHERGTGVARALGRSAHDDARRRAPRRPSSADSWLTVPVARTGAAIGAVVLVRSAPGRPPFGEEDVPLARELARRAAQAIENARRHGEQGEVALRLQEGLLPRALPDVPGLELSAHHHPGERGTLVGGDFYDVFPSGPRDWTVTVGDVAGKGPRAAALTGLARHTARAVGRGAAAPAALLRAVNAAVLDERSPAHRFCTMACATLSQDGSRTRLALALGGHPYPLLRRSDGTVVPVGHRGTLLGVVPEPRLRTVHHTLHPGDLLLFYTDGVTEHRSHGVMLGEAGVRAVLARSPDASAEETVRLLAEEVAAHGPEMPADDFAVLAVRVR